MLDQLQNRAIVERLEQARAKSKIKQIDWPDRHIIGKDGKPVPFHLAQSAAYDSTKRTIVLSGGAQSGKTSIEIHDYIETGNAFLASMWGKRKKGYLAMGYIVEESQDQP